MLSLKTGCSFAQKNIIKFYSSCWRFLKTKVNTTYYFWLWHRNEGFLCHQYHNKWPTGRPSFHRPRMNSLEANTRTIKKFTNVTRTTAKIKSKEWIPLPNLLTDLTVCKKINRMWINPYVLWRALLEMLHHQDKSIQNLCQISCLLCQHNRTSALHSVNEQKHVCDKTGQNNIIFARNRLKRVIWLWKRRS